MYALPRRPFLALPAEAAVIFTASGYHHPGRRPLTSVARLYDGGQDSLVRTVEKEITELYEWVQTTLEEMP
jgi:hypothetical protein